MSLNSAVIVYTQIACSHIHNSLHLSSVARRIDSVCHHEEQIGKLLNINLCLEIPYVFYMLKTN